MYYYLTQHGTSYHPNPNLHADRTDRLSPKKIRNTQPKPRHYGNTNTKSLQLLVPAITTLQIIVLRHTHPVAHADELSSAVVPLSDPQLILTASDEVCARGVECDTQQLVGDVELLDELETERGEKREAREQEHRRE